jgi:hypothetical protein
VQLELFVVSVQRVQFRQVVQSKCILKSVEVIERNAKKGESRVWSVLLSFMQL